MKLDPASWLAIAELARHESLRDLVIAYGVSYETIRCAGREVDPLAEFVLLAADGARVAL